MFENLVILLLTDAHREEIKNSQERIYDRLSDWTGWSEAFKFKEASTCFLIEDIRIRSCLRQLVTVFLTLILSVCSQVHLKAVS